LKPKVMVFYLVQNVLNFRGIL